MPVTIGDSTRDLLCPMAVGSEATAFCSGQLKIKRRINKLSILTIKFVKVIGVIE